MMMERDLTMRVPHVDKVEADDVVPGVFGPWRGLVQAVEVEARGPESPHAQKLQWKC